MVYSYGLALISQRQGNGTVSFFGSDGLGSTRFLTSTNGTITDTYTYDAFGTVIASTGSTPNSYLFNGQQSDSTLGGLLYLRQRYDIPSLGRLLTRDADEGVPFDPPTLHKYVYCADNPVNRIDPSGNDFVDVMASMYVQAQLATATFFATHGALADTAILVGAISAYNSAQLLSTGIDPDTGEPATVLAAAFGIMDFLPAGEFITKPLGKSAKKLYRAAAVNIWDSLSKVKRTIEDQVHHRIPLEWAHLFPDRNPNRIANLQLIERKIHEGPDGVSAAWTRFRNSLGGRSPTAKEVSDKAAELDARFGSHVKTLE
jgi:RHS repeat-associated protein